MDPIPRTLLLIFLATLLSTPSLQAQVRLDRYPQKVVTHRHHGRGATAAGSSGLCDPKPVKIGTATWSPATRGVVRDDPSAAFPDDRRQYFHGRRYLLDDAVCRIEPDGRSAVAIHTKAGVSRIEFRPMTMLEKAGLFEERVRLRHDRYGLVASSALTQPHNLASNQLQPSDNDGLWTAIYAAAESFRYAVTKSDDARARARRALEALLYLEQVTGKSGLPARSYIKRGDRRRASGTWHTSLDGAIEWKADTSSDEIVGHFFAFGVAWDLLDDPALKDRIAATCRRIADHIVGNGYYLIDIHGQPTYWGRWSHEYFNSHRGREDSPLNALELLSFLKTAHHITGDVRYENEYRKVAFDKGYAALTARLLELRVEMNYSDEELAMLPFYLLFRYEKDAGLLATYRRALEQWWQNMRRERNPLWTLIYLTANPGKDAGLSSAVHTLYRIPLDLITYTVDNSWRPDIEWEGTPDRNGLRQAKTWLPPDERPVMKWNSNPFRVDGGNGGRSEDDGAFFLLPYWLGRYHGLLTGQ